MNHTDPALQARIDSFLDRKMSDHIRTSSVEHIIDELESATDGKTRTWGFTREARSIRKLSFPQARYLA